MEKGLDGLYTDPWQPNWLLDVRTNRKNIQNENNRVCYYINRWFSTCSELRVWVYGRFRRNVDHYGFSDQILKWDLVHCPFALREVDRRIDVGPAVLRRQQVVRFIPFYEIEDKYHIIYYENTVFYCYDESETYRFILLYFT